MSTSENEQMAKYTIFQISPNLMALILQPRGNHFCKYRPLYADRK